MTPQHSPTVFQSKGMGVELTYPAGWVARSNPDYVLDVSPDAAHDRVSISLDVPRLPPHIPGLIPLGSVVNGYLDDLKKQAPGVEIERPTDTTVAGARARRVRSSWESSGEMRIEIAVLTVNKDRVYIFRANAAESHERDVATVFDQMLESVKW